ncbi:Zygote arrest protein 1 [Mizuhopecten yessoensis]|uniref:Zygote arrest protein 1 n=1 Tax=Mizuhopecten yessoensis TaxID=6573 RepID=A0A210QF36_MIZYE|nr:Zygote arrest protein 1 [Mizuhopecten yessoensis]
MFQNQGQGGQQTSLERRYGFFRCLSCKGEWQSSHVYCIKGTTTVYYKQDCKNCKTACNPYKVEDVKCPMCGKPAKECQGMCDHPDDD